jgi:Lrp/AsnC family transcriptional regulator for asnA, asnC and gidA
MCIFQNGLVDWFRKKGVVMSQSEKKSKSKKIDQTDRKIIKLLQKDGRISNTLIAKNIGISEATVRTRLNRLLDEEYIQVVAVSNPLKLGFEVTGIIRLDVELKRMESVVRELKKIDAIWYLVRTTGISDIYAEFVVRSMEELDELISKKMHRINGVLRTDTSLIIRFVKRRYDWGTGLQSA